MATGEFSDVKLLAGSFGVTGYADGTGTSAQFNEPSQGDVDEEGNFMWLIGEIIVSESLLPMVKFQPMPDKIRLVWWMELLRWQSSIILKDVSSARMALCM